MSGHLSRRDLLIGASAAGMATALQHSPSLAKAPMQNVQAPAVYRFRIGAIEATAISDGPLALGAPQADLFVGVSKDDFVRTLLDNYLPADSVTLEQNILLLNSGDRLVLFDTGLGPEKPLGPGTGRLIPNLKAAGIDPNDVDAVVLTHAHSDHCWGLTADSGGRNFPNAQIYMSQADFDFWTDEANGRGSDLAKQQVDGARKHLLPNRERIAFIKDGQEFLRVAGDIAHHHAVSTQYPRAPMAFDTAGQQAVASRIRMFDMLTAQRVPLLAYHFPWPGIGFIAKQGDAYRYVASPVQTAR
jgi:glyoxylase-like metal-dependent hydrolase (beta-lactamase superfamily II)